MNIKNIKLALGLMFAATVGFTSCADEPDKYESTGGKPTISYFRLADVNKKDSIITGAYMQTPICIVGENLKSIKYMYFNDQKATLNTSYITDNTLLVTVPKDMPAKVTDKLYVVTADNDSLSFDFKVLVNAPNVTSMENEWAKDGERTVIYGDFFYTYADNPVKVTFPNGQVVSANDEDVKLTPFSIELTVPENAGKGYITVESVYGKGRSKFYFRDDRFILFDWDGTHGKALASGHGWRNGKIGQDAVAPLDGNYLMFGPAGLAGDNSTWAEDDFSFNYWPEPSAGYPELSSMYDFSDPANTVLKFEVNIPESNKWAACALQVIFTGNDEVTFGTPTNSYIGNNAFPRALWSPWYTAAGASEYHTSGKWRTVTIPLSNLKYGPAGENLGANINRFTGLTFFVYNGPYQGTNCEPAIYIDNIRIAPAN